MDDVVRIAARAYEQDRYLSALLGPRGVRGDLIALYAFAGEVARIASVVSEPMMGEIRLQWWRDAISGEHGVGAAGHPVAEAVVAAVRRHQLPRQLLVGLINAEEGQVHGGLHADGQELSSYFAKRDGALFALAWRIRGGGAEQEPEILSRAGQVYGRVRMLVEFGALAAEGRTLLPQTDLARCGLSVEQIRADVDAPNGLAELLGEFRAEALADWRKIKAEWRAYPASVKAVLLPLALVEPYLSAQERLGADCLRNVAEISPLTRVVRLWLAHQFGRN